MLKSTSYFRGLYSRTRRMLFFGILGVCSVLIFSWTLSANNHASALTASTINYQARLLQSNGAIAPDGTYNVEFKLYSALTGGSALWTEDYLVGTTTGISVADGYLTANLGSQTAFPTTINWGSQLYLTMNIGGTSGSVVPTATSLTGWDGEMSPRIQLTSVPYAFEANSALTATTLTNTSGSYTDTLQFLTPGSTATITVPGVTGTVCLQTSTSCGFATGSGSAILQSGNSFGTTVTIGSTTAYGINLITNNTTVASLSSTGAATFKNSTNSTTAFQVQNSSAASVLNVDTTNSRVAVDSSFTTMTSPTISAHSTVTTGGTLAAATYYYEVTAVDATGGQTTPSAQVTQATTGSASTVTLTWAPIAGAESYNVYRSTVTGVYTTDSVYSTLGIVSGSNLTFIDTGATAPITNTAPPTTTTAQVATNTSNSALQVSIGGNGTPTGQLYVSGTVPTSAIGSVAGSGTAYDDYVQGDYAYVVNASGNSLQIFDVSNPASPVSVGSVGTGAATNPGSVFVQGHYAYVGGDASSAFVVIDVSNPASPVVVGTLAGVNLITSVFVQGSYAYVTNEGNNTMEVINISNPASPYVAGTSAAILSSPVGVYVSGRYAYVSNQYDDLLQIFDISNPASPISDGSVVTGSGSAADPGGPVFVQGDYAYVPSGASNTIEIVNISNPTSPRVVGISATTGLNDPTSIYVQGRYAYVANDNGGTLQIFDVSNPTSPTSLGSVSSGIGSNSVFVQGRYAYVTAWAPFSYAGSLQIFDLGGEYTQQLQAGGAEVGTLTVDTNEQIAGNSSIAGGLNVGGTAQVSGNLGVGGNLTVTGSLQGTNNLGTPVPTITQAGTAGSTHYSYAVSAVNANGTTPASAPVQTTTGNATENGTNYNIISWSAVTGATSYNVYRTASSGTPATTGLIGNTASTSFNDTAIVASGSVPTTDTTGTITANGALTVNGSTTVKSVINSTTAFQVQNASGTTVLNANTSTLSINADALSAPGNITTTLAPTISATTTAGTAGSTTYTYEVVAASPNGSFTYPSPTNSIATGNATLTSTNYNIVSWGTVTGATNYYVYRTASGGSPSSTGLISVVAAGTTTLSDKALTATGTAPALTGALTNSTAYYFKVTAIDGTGGQTTASTETTSTTATTGTNLAITLSWVPVTGARGYDVYYATTSGGETNGYFTTYTNSYTFTTISGTTAGTIPTTATAYNNTLSTSGNSQITIGNTTGSASTAQLDVAGNVPTSAVGSVATGSSSTNVSIQGNYAYEVNGGNSTLDVVDISNPANPIIVDTASTGSGPVSISVQGNYAYVATYSGAQVDIYNISNPANVYMTSQIFTGNQLDSIFVNGFYAYVAYSNGWLEIFNVSNPGNPTSVGGLSVGINYVAVQGNYAYVGDTSGFQIINISNPASPSIVGTVPIGTIGNVYIQGNYAYAVNYTSNNLDVINISNIANPYLVGSVPSGTGAVYVQAHYAYVTSSTSLQVFDISNPASPLNVGSVAITGPNNVVVQGRYAYVGTATSLRIYDLGGAYIQQLQAGGAELGTLAVDSSASIGGSEFVAGAETLNGSLGIGGSLQLAGSAAINGTVTIGTSGTSTSQLYVGGTVPTAAIGSVTTNVLPIFVQGNYVYGVSGSSNTLQVYNISNPAAPVLVGTSATTGINNPSSIYVSGRYAYVTNNTGNTLQIFDVSNPANPVSVGSVNTGSGPVSAYIQGSYAYVVNYGSNTLQVINISNASTPVVVGTVTTGSSPSSVYVQGRYAYVANSGGTLQVFDISNPTTPISVASVAASGANGVYVQNGYAYVAESTQIQIFNISIPTSPVSVGSAGTSTYAGTSSIFVQGRYAYVNSPGYSVGSVTMFDVSNPAAPAGIGTIYSGVGSYPGNMVVQGRYGYFDAGGQLQVYDMGGSYIQQLQAGGAEVGTLQVDSNANISGSESITSGLNVGGTAQVSGSLGVGGNLTVTGSLQGTNNLGTPVPTITQAGTAGSTHYSYAVSAVNANGTTPASAPVQTTTGNATENGTNYNIISWSAVTGATSYNVYRTASSGTPATTGLIGNTASTSFNDTAIVASGSVPTTDTTGTITANGALTVNGSTTVKSVINSTTAFQVQNAAGNSVLAVNTTAGQVTIGSAATIVTTAVQEWEAYGTNMATLAVAPHTPGNLMALAIDLDNTAISVTGVSGGGVSQWTQVIGNSDSGSGTRTEIWRGTVTTAGASTITVTYSSTPGVSCELTAQEFTAGLGANTNWSVATSGSAANSSSTTITFPTLVASQSGGLYWGYMEDFFAYAGSTPGFSYVLTPDGSVVAYDTNTTSGSYTPTTTQSSSSTSHGVAMIIAASVSNTLNVFGAATITNVASTTAFQVQNSSSNNILSVDTSGNKVVLGNQSGNAGDLVFDDGTNSNTIQLSASSGTAAYSLTLPISTPTSNLCLESGSVSSPGQLQFTSCYNTTPTISAVAGGSWSGTATSGTTVTGGTLSSVAPTNVGDLMVVTTSLPSTAGSVTSISGGGVTTWTAGQVNAAVGSALRVETWFGTVTSTGTHALTLTHSGTLSSGTAEVDVTEFTAQGVTSSSTWGIDALGVASSSTNTSTLNMANLAPSQSGELYYGFANDQSAGLGSGGSCPNVPSAGTTWTCTTSAGGQSNVVDYDLSSTAGTVGGYNGRVLLGSSSVNYNSVAMLFNAFISSTAINNSVSTQFGNFNVQAPDTGSVAGVLEAGVGSSQDILDIRNSAGVNVDTFGSTGNTVIAPSTVSTTAFQVENSSAVPIVTVDTSNDKLVLNSTVSGNSGLQFSDLTSSSTASSNFSQLLGVDSSGNVGLSTAGVALTSPALAYWDGLNNPTVTGQSYPQATLTGAYTSYSTANGIQLTDTSTTFESGSVNWNFSQVPFEEIQFQFKAGGGTGADATWFYSYANATPTTEYGTGMAQGYIIYFSEYHGCIGIAWASFTDGNQCLSGGGANPLASVAEANIGNNAWHNVDIQIRYNVITVRWDGVVVLTTSDIYTRNTSDLNFGFGSRTGGSTNNHYIKGLLVTKLGSVAGDFGINSVSPIVGNLNWDSTNNYLGINSAAPSASLDDVGTALFTGSTSATDFQVQNATSVSLLTVNTSANSVIIGSGTGGDGTGYLLGLDNKNTTGDPTEVNGAMYYNSYTGNFRCGEVGTWENCLGGLLASNTAISTVNTCTTVCAAFSNPASLAANYCTPGRVITITMGGVYSSTTAITLSLGVYWGTNVAKASDTPIGVASPAYTTPATSTNLPWSLNYQINCQTATTAIGSGIANFGGTTSTITPEWMNTNASTTITTTSAENIYVFPAIGTSLAGDTITANTISITGN